MRTAGLAFALTLAVGALGCGATTRNVTTAIKNPSVANASLVFMTRDDGKDEDSAVTVHLLDHGRLGAEATIANVDYHDQSVSPPVPLSFVQPVHANDLDNTQIRVRLTPDGKDTWTFDMRLTLTLADGTQRSFFWSGLRLDETRPEIVMPFSTGRLP